MMSAIIIEGHQLAYDLKQQCEKSTSSQGCQDTPFDFFHNRNKQKSELCKKYMEQGYCPYQAKCKFAHGKNQLRCNNHINNRYKTKQCGGFFKKGTCSYGQRCNFLHAYKIQPFQQEIRWRQIKMKFRQFFEEIRQTSRFFPK